MNTLTIEGWRKPLGAQRSMPVSMLHFRVDDDCHLRLEEAEDQLMHSDAEELFVPINIDTMELETSSDCGELNDCQLRVYLDRNNHRGQFHLVAHQVDDDSLVYSNAVMIDQLG